MKLMVGGEIIPDQLKKATKVTDDLRNHLCIRDVLPLGWSVNKGVTWIWCFKVSAGMSTAEQKKATRSRFEAVFPVIADELLSYMKGEGMPKEAVEWMKTVRVPPSPLPLSYFSALPVPREERCEYGRACFELEELNLNENELSFRSVELARSLPVLPFFPNLPSSTHAFLPLFLGLG